MLTVFSKIRRWVEQQPLYLDARWNLREGLSATWRRVRIQRLILKTPAILTANKGPVEVRVLTWRRDFVSMLWALKSFYHFAEVNYPLYVHNGGLLPANLQLLRKHFPHAHVVDAAEADRRVSEFLVKRGLVRCEEYRRGNVATQKLFDYFVLSTADRIISTDSDVVFFAKPVELCEASVSPRRNRYNKDEAYSYSMSEDECRARLGTVPVGHVNSGLFSVWRDSIDFEAIERWLAEPKLFEDKWVTEQTLHALCSTVFGIELLPDRYLVSTKTGLDSTLVCKHYPGFYRPLLYQEGMAHLVRLGFLESLASGA
jgi:hypothetical protein